MSMDSQEVLQVNAKLTAVEKAKLAYYRTPEGEKVWRVSDLAWAEYQKLEQKEKHGS